MAGNFQSYEVPGKVQFGTAWWFNDTIDGMENEIKTLANIGLLVTLSACLLILEVFSFPRHEYFRRILCNILGAWVDEGKVPKDLELLSSMFAIFAMKIQSAILASKNHLFEYGR